MMENDDKLLVAFFDENRQEIPDNGFTRRVMRHLPDRTRRISQLWVTFCFTLALVLFFAFDGLQLVLGTLRETFTVATQSGVTGSQPQISIGRRHSVAFPALSQNMFAGLNDAVIANRIFLAG